MHLTNLMYTSELWRPFFRYQVDNCSYTARLGSRKWAPRFDYILDQQVGLLQNLRANATAIYLSIHAQRSHTSFVVCGLLHIPSCRVGLVLKCG